MKACTYSPLPIESYFINALPMCSQRTILNTSEPEALWNMVWLSFPLLDNLPGSGARWYEKYKSDPDVYRAASMDVLNYDYLAEMLKEHPAKFAAWFAKQDHKSWACYENGGGAWVATVLERAAQSATNLASNVKIEGNVVRVKFRGFRV